MVITLFLCTEQTSYRFLTGKIWKDSKHYKKNKSSGVRKTFSFPPKSPRQKKEKKKKKEKRKKQWQKERKKESASSKKNITMKHTNDGSHLTQHARPEVPPNWSLSVYTQTRQQREPGGPRRSFGVYKVFSSIGEGKKFLTRSKTL